MTKWLVTLALVSAACGSGANPDESTPTAPERIPAPAPSSSAPTTTTAASATTDGTTTTVTDLETCDAPDHLAPDGNDTRPNLIAAYDGSELTWVMETVGGRPLTLVDGAPFVLIGGIGLAAIDADSCDVLWTREAEGDLHATVSETSMVIADGSRLARVTYDFEEAWTVATEPAAAIAVLGELILVVTDNSLDVRSLATGELVNTHGLSFAADLVVADPSRGALVGGVGFIMITDEVGGPLHVIEVGGDVRDLRFAGPDHVAVLADGVEFIRVVDGAVEWTYDVGQHGGQPLVWSHDELHVLDEFGQVLHLGTDGGLIFTGSHAADQTLVDLDLVIEVDMNGRVGAVTMLEQPAWVIQLPGDGWFVSDIGQIGGKLVIAAEHSDSASR